MHSKVSLKCRGPLYAGCSCPGYALDRPPAPAGSAAAVIDLAGVGIVINRLKAEAAEAQRAHTAQLEGVKLRAQGIIAMLEEGRRGDAMKALRALAADPSKLKVSAGPPDEPARA